VSHWYNSLQCMCYVFYNITTLAQNIYITQNYSIIIECWGGTGERNWRSRPFSTHRYGTTLFLYIILLYRPLYSNTLKVFGGVLEKDRLWGRHRFALTSRFVVHYILRCGGVECRRRRLCINKLYIFLSLLLWFFHGIQLCIESRTVSLFNNASEMI